jgi:hypothetical protein
MTNACGKEFKVHKQVVFIIFWYIMEYFGALFQFDMLSIPKTVRLYHGHIHGISGYDLAMPFALCMPQICHSYDLNTFPSEMKRCLVNSATSCESCWACKPTPV